MDADVNDERADVVTVTLPRLVGGRERATQYLDEHRTELKEADVLVDCHLLRSGSASFADQLVIETLVDAQSTALILVGAPPSFVEYVQTSAKDKGVEQRVQVVQEMAQAHRH